MSHRILGSFVTHAIPKASWDWHGLKGCCCVCHTHVYVRVQSAYRGHHFLGCKKNTFSHTHLISSVQWCDTQKISLQKNTFKSNYLLYTWPHVSFQHNQQQQQQYHHLARFCDINSLFIKHMGAQGFFHTDVRLNKEETKVEKSVKALKDKVVKSEKVEETVKNVEDAVTTPDEPKTKIVPKKSLWERVVAELKHYYHGFRLLFIDIRICIRLLWDVLNGRSLTRRERRQLVRTTADMFRLVPFLVFILVPFMEFLLPVAIKLFPNMLPSTFAEKDKEQEKLKKNLKLKLQMAKFLQETIHEFGLQGKKKQGGAVEEFSQFVEKIRSQGIRPTTEEIMHFAKLFEDEITLDNLSHQQLQAVCRVLNIQPIGIDAFLRFQLDLKLRQLAADDKMILKEGIDSLSIAELQSANRARGMRALGVPEERLKEQLQQWLTLHLEKRIPTSLLLLSRALYLPETLSEEEKLHATITELAQSAPTAAKLKAAEIAGEAIDNKTRLDIIKHEENIIAAERDARRQEQEAEEERVRQQEREMAEAQAAQSAMEHPEHLRDEALILEPAKSELLIDKAKELTGTAEEQKALKDAEKEEHITVKDLEEIETALEEIAEHKQLNIEKEELKDLKEEISEYKEDLMDLKEVIVSSGAAQDEMVESKPAKHLTKRVDRLIGQIDSVMDELQAEKKRFQEEVEVGEVRLKSSSELQADESKVEEVRQHITESKNNIITINEMLLAMKRLKKLPIETKLQRIVEVLDDDKDGKIDINLALKVLELLAQENVKFSKEQVSEMVNLLKCEMELEEKEKQEGKEKQKQAEEAQHEATSAEKRPGR
ncbi:hypothetical protein C0Q70_09207 [Pomacea canaliculata]|uniref:Mitochondrial proton/calcium exchanger protein n=1 Tax=Pomacea canaliculata TaxID=400727 RepID=A0A2T7P969_POMCA|nr:hypothetical protein C0Q70_09207 [Pomacea canaliculata]